ncbi:MAG: type II toxin-antitoxin system HicB family antitoxin, partial [Chloroflexi bacterium]|nr:type II toxin-antitoxin system HicB family antitoxin [Chloroflexota bacterium]
KVFTAYIEIDPDTGMYVGIVPGIPGAHTQAETLDELQKNLKEVLELCLEEYNDSGFWKNEPYQIRPY